MPSDPILLVGGAGTVGRHAARQLRAAHPDLPLLLGSRDLAKAGEFADVLGQAEAVALDLRGDDLGIGRRSVGAVAVLFTDRRLATLRFAQARGVPHLSISPLLHEIGPEVGSYMHRPNAAPVVLGTEWLVGATTVPALDFAREFRRVDVIRIGALLDDLDVGGPAQTADLEHVTGTTPAALARRDGAYVWRTGEDATANFRAVDGTDMAATPLSPNDVLGLALATGAPDVTFDLATGVSSSRRRGQPMSTEIVIGLSGTDHAGRPLRTRHAIVHPSGQFPLTGLGVAMLLERLVGLDGGDAPPAGLYFPYQLLEPAAYLARLRQIGGRVLTLDPDT